MAHTFAALGILLMLPLSANSQTELWDKVRAGGPVTVKTVLESETAPDLEALDDAGDTVLLFAAGSGYMRILEQLLAAGANTEATNADGVTPLYVAVQLGLVAPVERLLAAGANTEAADIDGLTPLWHAVNLGLYRVVEMLLDAGADTEVRGTTTITRGDTTFSLWEVRDDRNFTPLGLAVRQHRRGFVELLLQRGADASVLDLPLQDFDYRGFFQWYQVAFDYYPTTTTTTTTALEPIF